MIMYSALIYPETPIDGSYTRPELPITFGSFYASSPSWNPYSNIEADRIEYWEDSEGTLTLEEVNTTLYGVAGAPVPTTISRAQGRMALLGANLLTAVESHISTAPMAEQIAYEASNWSRSSPSLNAMANALGLTSDQVDSLFISAATIVV